MKAGEIILVKFPFTNLETTKKRPCLILNEVPYSAKLRLVTVAMITSRVESLPLKGDVLLKHWEKAGLLHPSLVRLAKIATLEGELVEKQLGVLATPDLKEIKKKFSALFGSWV